MKELNSYRLPAVRRGADAGAVARRRDGAGRDLADAPEHDAAPRLSGPRRPGHARRAEVPARVPEPPLTVPTRKQRNPVSLNIKIKIQYFINVNITN